MSNNTDNKETIIKYVDPNIRLARFIEDLLISKNVKDDVMNYFNSIKWDELFYIIKKQYINSTNLQFCLPTIVELFLLTDKPCICERIIENIKPGSLEIDELKQYLIDNAANEKSNWKIYFVNKWLKHYT